MKRYSSLVNSPMYPRLWAAVLVVVRTLFIKLAIWFFRAMMALSFGLMAPPSGDYGFTFWVNLTLSYLSRDRVVRQVPVIIWVNLIRIW